MRLVALVLALAVTLLLASLAYAGTAAALRRREARAARAARWQFRQFTQGDDTVVTVSLLRPGGEVLDEHVVARIATDDPEWTARYLDAKEIAEERAFHLNTGGTPLPG